MVAQDEKPHPPLKPAPVFDPLRLTKAKSPKLATTMRTRSKVTSSASRNLVGITDKTAKALLCNHALYIQDISIHRLTSSKCLQALHPCTVSMHALPLPQGCFWAIQSSLSSHRLVEVCCLYRAWRLPQGGLHLRSRRSLLGGPATQQRCPSHRGPGATLPPASGPSTSPQRCAPMHLQPCLCPTPLSL